MLIVHMDGGRYGIPLDEVLEILPVASVVPLPGAPTIVTGLLDLRGEPVPVIDLRTRIGRPSRQVLPTDHLVVCRARGRVVAVLVDRAEEVADVPAGDLQPVEEVAASLHLSGVARTVGGLILVVDLPGFLSADEVLGLDRALETAGALDGR